MNRLPDIIVLDFCIWLRNKIKSNNPDKDAVWWREIYSSNEITSFAKEYLLQQSNKYRNNEIPVKSVIEGFLLSDEFHRMELQIYQRWYYNNYKYNKNALFAVFENSFYYYFRKYFMQFWDYTFNEDLRYDEIDSDHLAEYTLEYINEHMRLFNNMPTDNLVLNFMIRTKNEVADEINFLEWITEKEQGNPSLENMPSEVFNDLLDEYIKDNKKSAAERKKLKDDYYHKGWSAIFRKIQSRLGIEGRYLERSLDEVMNRYLSKQAKFNCIILPLADKKSKEKYHSLIKDHWRNLNDLSGETLDIYYSETDIGKTGYDIASRIHLLPDKLRKTAPSLVIWKDSIAEAKAVSIEGLDVEQIRIVIKSIVQQIEAGEELNTIIEEALKMTEKQQELNHGVTNNNTYINRSINGSIISDSAVNTGDNNVVIKGDGNTVNQDNDLIMELDKAISAIKTSEEINEEEKESLVSIMENAREAELENSENKRELVKKLCGVVKGFLRKTPILFSTLASLTKIASYFGLNVK